VPYPAPGRHDLAIVQFRCYGPKGHGTALADIPDDASKVMGALICISLHLGNRGTIALPSPPEGSRTVGVWDWPAGANDQGAVWAATAILSTLPSL
jgi:hypothetical protein